MRPQLRWRRTFYLLHCTTIISEALQLEEGVHNVVLSIQACSAPLR